MSAQLTGEVKGTVTDTAGETLPGVTLTLSNGEPPHTIVSDASGRFRFNHVQAGIYELKAVMPGFATYDRKNIQVTVGQTVVIDPVLTPERGV